MILRLFEDLSDSESDVGHGVLHGLLEGGQHLRRYLVLGQVGEDLLQRHQAAHPIVVALLIRVIVL